MSSFVEPCDAREFTDEILSLFHRNGQKLPYEYFEWYYGHNGNEAVHSWVIRGSAERAIVGLCSVVQRTLRFGDRVLRAGVVGNLMVDEENRAIGGLALLRSLQSLVFNERLDILLSMPTLTLPTQLVLRMGFRSIGAWQTYVQIFRSRAALYARSGAPGAAVSPFVDLIAALRRRFSFFCGRSTLNLRLEELGRDQISRLSVENWPALDGRFLADFSTTMLKARFLRQPLSNYRVIGIADRQEGRIRGYLVTNCQRGRVIVYHCRTDPRLLSDADAILTLCRDGRRYGQIFGVITLRGSNLSNVLGQFGFITLPPKFGGCRHSLLGFWRPDHPLAQYFGVPSCWNVFPSLNDV